MPTTPNMSMVLPTEGASDNVWDTLLNAALTLNDAHDHTTGKGVKVPTAGLNINADLSFAGAYALTNLLAADFTPTTTASVAALAGAFFVNSADSNNLYWRTPSGTNVKVIDGTTLNVSGFAGGIGGDYSSAGALVDYVAASDIYRFRGPDPGSGRPWEALATGHHDFYEQATTVANRVRLQSPAALAASYTVTFPAAVPAALAMTRMSSAGALTASNAVTRTAQYNGALGVPLAGSAADHSTVGTTALKTATQYVTCPCNFEVGEVITAWSAKLNKASASGTITAEFVSQDAAGTQSQIGSSQTNAGVSPGAIALGATGLSTTVASGSTYFIRVSGGGTTGDLLTGWTTASNGTLAPA